MFFQQVPVNLLDFLKKEKRMPSSMSFDPYERDLSHVTYTFHKKYLDGFLHPKVIERLKDAHPKFFSNIKCKKRRQPLQLIVLR